MSGKRETRQRLLVVEDDAAYRRRLVGYLSEDYHCDTTECGEEAEEQLDSQEYNTILLDLDFGAGRMDGFEFLEKNRHRLLFTPVIVVTQFKEMDKIIKAIQLGAYGYYVKDTDMTELEITLRRALGWHRLKTEASMLSEKLGELQSSEIVGKDPKFLKVVEEAKNVAGTSATVLLTGESGTGKWVLAKWIHKQSERRGAFVDVNCPAIPETLFESELFGYVRGAFTGANVTKKGFFEMADGGTLFLDEVGEIGVNYQRKLLKAIDEKNFYRVGDTRPTCVDVRIIAATSADLEDLIDKGRFKSELYYRLNTYQIHIPPLRERPTDITALTDHFIQRFARLNGKAISGITDRARDYLAMHNWNGNVRELKNVIESAVIRCNTGMISISHILLPGGESEHLVSYKEAKDRCLREFQKKYMLRMLERTQGNISEISQLTGLSRVQCHKLIKEFGFEAEPS